MVGGKRMRDLSNLEWSNGRMVEWSVRLGRRESEEIRSDVNLVRGLCMYSDPTLDRWTVGRWTLVVGCSWEEFLRKGSTKNKTHQLLDFGVDSKQAEETSKTNKKNI